MATFQCLAHAGIGLLRQYARAAASPFPRSHGPRPVHRMRTGGSHLRRRHRQSLRSDCCADSAPSEAAYAAGCWCRTSVSARPAPFRRPRIASGRCRAHTGAFQERDQHGPDGRLVMRGQFLDNVVLGGVVRRGQLRQQCLRIGAAAAAATACTAMLHCRGHRAASKQRAADLAIRISVCDRLPAPSERRASAVAGHALNDSVELSSSGPSTSWSWCCSCRT